MSADFDRFLASNFFGDPFNAGHDGVDVPLLTCLTGDELARAEEMLLRALPDSRAVVGLGAIHSQKAVAPLHKLIGSPDVSTEAAVALLKISGDASGIDAIIKTLRDQRNHWSKRMDAASALRQFRLPKAVDALLDALNDPEKLVRYHASNSLLILYGQMSENDVQTTPEVSIRMMRDGERAAAAGALRRLVREGKLDG